MLRATTEVGARYSPDVIVCVPIAPDGSIDPRWGRAERVAVAKVEGDAILDWREFDVHWGTLHDSGPEGQHHARIATFLKENRVEAVIADHIGPPMQQMLSRMDIAVRLGASGDARASVVRAT